MDDNWRYYHRTIQSIYLRKEGMNTLVDNKLIDRLNKKSILVSDGATGTSLQQRGLPKGLASEVWVLENPQAIIDLHKDFISGGSDIILTCTFSGSSIRLAQSNLKDRTVEVNKKAVDIAHKAIEGNDVLIAASIGPSGMLLEPYGTLSIDDARSNYLEQVKALDQSGIDLFVVETQFDINEARIILEAIRSISQLPLVCSFSFDRGKRTMMGITPSQIAKELGEFDLSAIGINCGKSLEDNLICLNELKSVTTLPIWFKPNAGMPKIDNTGKPTYDITPGIMGSLVKEWIKSGASIIGGCCGTSPTHLTIIAKNIL